MPRTHRGGAASIFLGAPLLPRATTWNSYKLTMELAQHSPPPSTAPHEESMQPAPPPEPAAATPSTPEPAVTLVSREGTPFRVDRQTAEMSVLVRAMLEGDMSTDEDEDEADAAEPAEIPLPNVAAPVLEKVLAFCRHHVAAPMLEIEKPLRSENMHEVVEAWYADFVDMEQEALFDLILAANYLDIPPLLDLGTAKVASLIKGKTPEEIRKTFQIVNDFTPEEEAEVRAENEWCEQLEEEQNGAATAPAAGE